MVDSHLPRFSQGVLAVGLALAFLFSIEAIVPVLAVALLAAVAGGPRWNVFAYAYRALPLPRGEPEPAAPPRFSQTLGVAFLALATVGLLATRDETLPWWLVGWGPALAVAVLATIAASGIF